MKRHLFAISVLLVGALFADPYRPPDLEKEIFDTDKIELNKIARAALFSGLLSVGRDYSEEENDVNFELRGHALAIAGRLNPDSENFKDVLDQLENRGEAIPLDYMTMSRTSGKIYRGVISLMREEDNEANKTCAAYCVDIVLRLDPDSRHADTLKDIKEKVGDADWEDMLKAPVFENPWQQGQRNNTFKERSEKIPGGEADGFAATQRSVYGLSVRTLSNGRHAGAASSLSATALQDDSVKGVEFHIDQKVGNMTGNSLEEIKKLMRVRHEADGRIPSGYKVEIAFEDKDGLLDGPSAGTAMSIILDSLFTGRELDDSFACTGAITADGKVTRIGGVAGKIRGATRKNCTLVGVPDENIKGVSDILVLDGVDPLINIQVFSFKTLDEALMVASKEKPEEVQAAIDDFNKVAKLIKDKGEASLASAAVVSKLESVVAKMPNHQSARILLGVAKGDQTTVLSLGGSFHGIDTKISGVAGKIQRVLWTEEFERSSTDKEDAQATLTDLEKISTKIDPRLKEYHEAILEVVKIYADGRKDSEKDEEFVKRLEEKWEVVSSKRQKLMDDPEIMEELMG